MILSIIIKFINFIRFRQLNFFIFKLSQNYHQLIFILNSNLNLNFEFSLHISLLFIVQSSLNCYNIFTLNY